MASKQLNNIINMRINNKDIILLPGSFTAESIATTLQDQINRDNTSPVVVSVNNGILSITSVYIGISQTLRFRSINDANFLGWNSLLVPLPSMRASTADFPFIREESNPNLLPLPPLISSVELTTAATIVTIRPPITDERPPLFGYIYSTNNGLSESNNDSMLFIFFMNQIFVSSSKLYSQCLYCP